MKITGQVSAVVPIVFAVGLTGCAGEDGPGAVSPGNPAPARIGLWVSNHGVSPGPGEPLRCNFVGFVECPSLPRQIFVGDPVDTSTWVPYRGQVSLPDTRYRWEVELDEPCRLYVVYEILSGDPVCDAEFRVVRRDDDAPIDATDGITGRTLLEATCTITTEPKCVVDELFTP